MRTTIATIAVLALATSIARADNAEAVAGTYDVKYEEVTSNCQNTGMVLSRGSLAIEKKKGTAISIDIDRIPLMAGSASKGGRIKAASKLGKTSIQGLDGRFSTAGTVNVDGVLTAVFVAEYYISGKAYCTQSWNVSGLKKEATKPASADDAAGTAFDLRTPMAY